MKHKSLVALFAVFLLCLGALAQQPFSFTANAVSLPGGKSTIAGTDAGVTLTVSPNFDVLQDNILGSGNAFQYFGAGVNYRLPVINTKLNQKFQSFLTASVGADRVPVNATDFASHYAFTVGGGLNYDLTNSGTYTMGARIQYARFPGYTDSGNTWIAEFGPSIHF